ncbi:hypothetical protein EPUS_02057 [Endocarpon pusillum Z07020]|uniref:tRNA-splicing endonuclease subunit Sen54 N-terminal domain-containing protein n=1 Tax=Endocarpon pusillum (strain Z07020 / HMAS-L-300199) TaxID=1263415 RepID=U1HUP0_ENDPU|nr:uncharacterized protein EPUS_02057 [Endocarpon pusillum Z07020]ERF74370.1 hypothetical protein EPUS_02057 [Endocarpon pusillum Z07020]
MDVDLSEETQDFRFLSVLTSNTTLANTTTTPSVASTETLIPKRGIKDFEPNPTRSQQNALRASRQAMHDVLSGERVHGSKNWVIGYFVGSIGGEGESAPLEGRDSGEDGIGLEDRDKRLRGCVVRIDQPRGSTFRTMGVSDRENRIWLLPEEALYCIERGSLDIRWGLPEAEKDDVKGGPVTGGNDEGSAKREGKKDDDDDDYDDAPAFSDLPMSLQGAYATFISDKDLTLARYTVFAGLRRLGYTVIRAPTWDDSAPPSSQTRQEDKTEDKIEDLPITSHARTVSPPSALTSQQPFFKWPSLRTFITRVFQLLFRWESPSKPYHRHPNSYPSFGPLVAPGLYRSYIDIYRALALIPFHNPTSKPQPAHTAPATTSSPETPSIQPQPPNPSMTSTTPPFRISYHVYKPTTPYRKTSPPAPDFRLAVIDAHAHATIPNLTELGTLLEEMPLHDPRKDEKLKKGRPEMRLKAGTRSVVLAVVDNGVVSFLRLAEMGSGREKIYEGKVGRGGGKRSGRGRGAGRGRGRGR